MENACQSDLKTQEIKWHWLSGVKTLKISCGKTRSSNLGIFEGLKFNRNFIFYLYFIFYLLSSTTKGVQI